MTKHPITRTALTVLAASAALVSLAACGDDDTTADASADTAAAPVTTATATSSDVVGETLTFSAVDYGYEGLPDEVAVGTRLALTNDSSIEVHEAVLFKLPDDEGRPLAEVVAASEADPTALGEFAGVLVGMPGEAGVEVEGPVVLDRPGRYAVVCFIPVGADPAVYQAAIESGTPPDVQGPPHASQGMVAELVVG